MTMQAILAIDQGTTYSKALLVDSATGQAVSHGSAQVTRVYPQPGWVESDPRTLWSTVEAAVAACLAARATSVDAVAVTNQRESVVAWDRLTGEPLGPCVGWQCRRTEHMCQDLVARGAGEIVVTKSGLPLDPSFSATKMRWLIDTVDADQSLRRRGRLCVGTVDSWLLWNLTGGTAFCCDVTNASRTQLLNLVTCDWDPELLDLFGIPRSCLPEIRKSASEFGICREPWQIRGVPVLSLIGDSHAALFAQVQQAPNAVKVTYGTGSSIMALTPHLARSRHGLTSTVGFATHEVRYALEGNVNATGAAVRWTRDLLGLEDDDSFISLATSVASTDGVYLVPAFAGLGAPTWDAAARGIVSGLTWRTERAHLARAALESIAFQVRDVIEALDEDLGQRAASVFADGGASVNDWLMQFQADTLSRPVMRSSLAELSALGAAWLAGTVSGAWRSTDLADLLPSPDCFEPHATHANSEAQYAAWAQAVRRAGSRW